MDDHHRVDDVAIEPCDSADVAAPLLPHNLAVVDPCFSSFYQDSSVHFKTNSEIRCLFHSPKYLMPENFIYKYTRSAGHWEIRSKKIS